MILKTNGKWEKIDIYTSRLKVPYGWVLRTFSSRSVDQIFIKDSTHEWEIEKD